MLARPLSLSFSPGTTPTVDADTTRPTAVPTLARVAGFAVARGWFALSIASLVIAGLLALALVVGRIPIISDWIADPLFFKRCLVVHVVLALVVWFHASAGAWISLLAIDQPRPLAARAALCAAAGGVGLMVFSGAARGANPILSNYVPVVEHPLFLAGLALFFGGAALCFGPALLAPASGSPVLPPETATGLRASAVAFCVALVTTFAALHGLPAGLPAATLFEFLFWGGGHVLQVANVSAMLALVTVGVSLLPFRNPAPAAPELVLSIEAWGDWLETAPASAAEIAARPIHMRNVAVTGHRERAPVLVQLTVDGALSEQRLRPLGLARDGACLALVRHALTPGSHDIRLALTTAPGAPPKFTWSGRLQFVPRRATVIAFSPGTGFLAVP